MDIFTTADTCLKLATTEGEYNPPTCATNVDIAQLLLDRGVDINWQGQEGAPLEAAAARGNEGVVKLLIENSATVTDRTFFNAAQACHVSVVKALLGSGASLPARDATSMTTLHHVALSHSPRSPELIDLLVQNGVRVADVDDRGLTPLHLAARKGSRLAVTALRERGASFRTKDLNNLNLVAFALSSPDGQTGEWKRFLLAEELDSNKQCFGPVCPSHEKPPLQPFKIFCNYCRRRRYCSEVCLATDWKAGYKKHCPDSPGSQ